MYRTATFHRPSHEKREMKVHAVGAHHRFAFTSMCRDARIPNPVSCIPYRGPRLFIRANPCNPWFNIPHYLTTLIRAF